MVSVESRRPIGQFQRLSEMVPRPGATVPETFLLMRVNTKEKEAEIVKYRISDIFQKPIMETPSVGSPQEDAQSSGSSEVFEQTDPPIGQGTQRTLKLWSKGSDVRALQQQLTELGFSTGKADGVYGNKTYNSVKKFQKRNDLKVDGVVGTETLQKLSEFGVEIPLYFAYEAEFPPGFSRKLSMGKEGMDVLTLQERLIELRYLEGNADQVFGKKTRAAVRKFQREHDMMVDGVAGVETLRLLFPE